MRRAEYPTYEQYQAIPRLAELREICLEIARQVSVILECTERLRPNRRMQIEGILEHLQGRLIGLGIQRPDPHAEAIPRTEWDNPRLMGEFTATQMFELCGDMIVSAKAATGVQPDELGQLAAHVTERPSEAEIDWAFGRTAVSMCVDYFDAEREWEEWVEQREHLYDEDN